MLLARADFDPWKTRTSFFWYNDREIFHSTQEDLDRQAAEMADRGIGHVITFSCTHFRWSFMRYWDQLLDTLAKVVRACHKRGIYATEHHSATLTFNPRNDDDISYLDDCLRVRKSARSSWPHCPFFSRIVRWNVLVAYVLFGLFAVAPGMQM